VFNRGPRVTMADPALGAASSPSRNLPRSAARSNERDRAPRILSENAHDTDGGKPMPVQVDFGLGLSVVCPVLGRAP